MSDPVVIQKAPDGPNGPLKKDYTFTWEDAATDPITVSVWTPPPPVIPPLVDIVVEDDTGIDSDKTILRLSGGGDGQNYLFLNEVTFTSGQTDWRYVTLECRSPASAISALDATVGGALSNSYISLGDADLYFAARRNSDDWADATAEEKEQVLLMATNQLEEYDYVGVVVDDVQVLKWPRMLNDNGDLIRTYPVDEIPVVVQRACCEVALSLLSSSGSVAAGAVDSVRVGSLSVTYATGTAATDTSDYSGLPISAARFLKGLRLQAVLA